MTVNIRLAGSLLLAAAGFVLVILGPAWPGRAAALMCGESIETIRQQGVFQSMDACSVAMTRASDAGTHCFCSVRESRLAPVYYLALVPVIVVSAAWITSRSTARGMAAVIVVLATTLLIPGPIVSWLDRAGIGIPRFFQAMAIAWPQFVLFGPILYRAEPGGRLVFPYQWAMLSTLAFWLVATTVFGLLARRVKSVPVLLVLATMFIAAIALAVRLVIPVFNWRMLIESP